MKATRAEPKLNACPFCGLDFNLGTKRELLGAHQTLACFYIVCLGCCGAVGPQGETEEEAIAAWNRRAPASTHPPQEDSP